MPSDEASKKIELKLTDVGTRLVYGDVCMAILYMR